VVSVARVNAATSAAALGRQELVIVAVKATGLASIGGDLRALAGPDTRVLFLQNGMPWWYPIGLPGHLPPVPDLPIFRLAAPLLASIRPAQVIAGIVYSANEMLAPGIVRNNSPLHNALDIAALDDRASNRVVELRRVLTGAGMVSNPVDDIRAAVWLKLIGNASASSLSVAMGNPSAIATDPAVRRVFLRIVEECLAAATAHGYAVAERLDLERWNQHRTSHKPSLLQDYERHKPMEIAEIVLAPLAFGRSAGLAMPTLDAVATIVARLSQDRGLYSPA
jgi:2-dehydropantoate 2-reductase